MEAKNKVSVFVGDFSSEENFIDFIKENFTEDGDIYSQLMNELNVDFIDSQFQEVGFFNKGIKKNDIRGFSYVENFINKIEGDLLKYNSIILLYNFDYIGKESLHKINHIGVFEYR